MSILKELETLLGKGAGGFRTVLDLGILARWVTKNKEGQLELNKESIRSDFPTLTIEAKHQSIFSRLLARVPNEPDDYPLNELNKFLDDLTEDQQADLHQSAADACMRGGEEQTELATGVVQHLINAVLIRHEDDATEFKMRKQYFDRMDWLKADPDAYGIVWLKKTYGVTIRSLNDLLQLVDQKATEAAAKLQERTHNRRRDGGYRWDPRNKKRWL